MTVKTPILTFAFVLASLVFAASPALAETATPQWTISAVSTPTNISPAAKPGEDHYTVLLTNTGGASSTTPVTITDELPAGLALDPAGASGENILASSEPAGGFSCALAACTYAPAVVPDQTLVLTFPLDVSAAEGSSLTNVVRVSGGGAGPASIEVPTVISAHPAGFGLAPGATTTALSLLQAGAHPDITNTYGFDSAGADGALAADTKDLVYHLPPGFASDFADTPVCEAAQLAQSECPIASQVGVTTVNTLDSSRPHYYIEPVYNIQPDPGHLAAISFSIGGEFFETGEISLQPRRYGAEVVFANIDNALAEILGGSLTVWGVPADPVHDPLRSNATGGLFSFGHPSDANPIPYFTNPTTCGSGQLESSFTADSWEQPGEQVEARMPYGPIVDCDRLTIEPQIAVQPSANSAEAATGLNVNLEMPQHYENPYGDVASNLEDAKVVLPAGMTVNPSSGAGLGACTEAQFAYEGGTTEPEAGRGCPSESKLGTAHARSPGVPENEEASGSLFLAKPYENKFGSLLAIYLVLRIPKHGVIVTAAGKVELNQETGQLTTTFDENPQLPVSDFVFTFHQGATSPLVTPPVCGTFSSEADLTPWSAPLQEHLLSSQFEITSGVNGGPCPSGGVPQFAPRITAGTNNNDAGSYTSLYLHIERQDGEQEITGFATQLPPGLTANLTGVQECSEADIEAARAATGVQEEASPSCPAGSEIGHSIAEAGVGSVLAQTPGKIYLGEPYEGAPFSIVSVTAAHVGPFDLGTVVIHFPLDLNPVTAAVTIPSGAADQIPHILKGIVIHVRDIRAYINRSDFMLNPTSCNPMPLSATVIGGGANPTNPADNDPVTVTNPFQTADCSSLEFQPKFVVTTSGKTSKADGASLHVDLTYPAGSLGSESNIREVKVDLPKQLPSRLTTLQKACTAQQFAANPAGCPAPSLIGTAKAVTPILPVPLEGPAYFVSHGGEAFPDLEIVLQGDGVTIVLTGNTFISKAGITSSTFNTIPDQPVSSFELTLPEGPYSALTVLGNLCSPTNTVTVKKRVTVKVRGRSKTTTRQVQQTQATTLQMPTEFVGQNGDTIHQDTPVSVTGCAKAVHPKKAKSKKHGKRRKGKSKK